MTASKRFISALASTALLIFLPPIQLFNLAVWQQPFEFNSRALAGITQGYVPPPGRGRLQRTEGAGSRGCDQAFSAVSFNLLAPNDHVPTTVSAHPTFLWYMSYTSLPVRFTLIERGVAEPIVEKQLAVEKPGIVALEMPADAPALVAGKEYRWTVSVVCNERRPSENPYAFAWIERVPVPPELVGKLKTAADEGDRALLYGRHGIWYDTISTIYKAYSASPEKRLNVELFSALLQQIGLSKVATQVLEQLTVGVRPKVIQNMGDRLSTNLPKDTTYHLPQDK